jgi:hypothetical protein
MHFLEDTRMSNEKSDRVLERVDIHRVQISALPIDSMDMNALGVCS